MTPPLNGKARIHVNDRCEVAEMLCNPTKTAVFVFTGGRQTGDGKFVHDKERQSHSEESQRRGRCLFFSQASSFHALNVYYKYIVKREDTWCEIANVFNTSTLRYSFADKMSGNS